MEFQPNKNKRYYIKGSKILEEYELNLKCNFFLKKEVLTSYSEIYYQISSSRNPHKDNFLL